MSEIQLFVFEGCEMEWFLDSEGNPVCQAQQLGMILGFTPSYIPTVVERIYPKFKFQASMGKAGRPAWYLREPGIYQMIFESKSDIAQNFQLFVFEDVLPKLRRGELKECSPRQEILNPKIDEAIALLHKAERLLKSSQQPKRLPSSTVKALPAYTDKRVEEFVTVSFVPDPLWDGKYPRNGYTVYLTKDQIIDMYCRFIGENELPTSPGRFVRAFNNLARVISEKFASKKVRDGYETKYAFFGLIPTGRILK